MAAGDALRDAATRKRNESRDLLSQIEMTVMWTDQLNSRNIAVMGSADRLKYLALPETMGVWRGDAAWHWQQVLIAAANTLDGVGSRLRDGSENATEQARRIQSDADRMIREAQDLENQAWNLDWEDRWRRLSTCEGFRAGEGRQCAFTQPRTSGDTQTIFYRCPAGDCSASPPLTEDLGHLKR